MIKIRYDPNSLKSDLKLRVMSHWEYPKIYMKKMVEEERIKKFGYPN